VFAPFLQKRLNDDVPINNENYRLIVSRGIILKPRESSFASLYIKTASSAWSPFRSIRINAAPANRPVVFIRCSRLPDR